MSDSCTRCASAIPEDGAFGWKGGSYCSSACVKLAEQEAPKKMSQRAVLAELSLTTIPERPSHITKLPGVNYQTMQAGFANIGPSEKWRKRAGRMVNVMWNPRTQKEFEPYLREAQEWLKDACMQLALASGGVCGPIEAQALATAAWQTAYARYWMAKSAEDPSNTTLFNTASKVADSARMNSLAAYDIAARLAKNRSDTPADPLSAFLDVSAPLPSVSASPSRKDTQEQE